MFSDGRVKDESQTRGKQECEQPDVSFYRADLLWQHCRAMALLHRADNSHDELWYTRPAERWLEALPVGNGRLGAMVFGGAGRERIALSESTAWSGAPGANDVNPGALQHLAETRQMLFSGRYVEAGDLCRKYLLGRSTSFGTNLPLPELQLSFDDARSTHAISPVAEPG